MSEIRKSKRITAGKRALTLDEELVAEEQKKRKVKQNLPLRRCKEKELSIVPSKNEESEDDEVRCLVCGTIEDDGESMVQCDRCHTWQHNYCMFQENTVPESYLCNVCDPHNNAYANLKFELTLSDYKQHKRKCLPLHCKTPADHFVVQDSMDDADEVSGSDLSAKESNAEIFEDETAESFCSQGIDRVCLDYSKPICSTGYNEKHSRFANREQEDYEIKSMDMEFNPIRKGIVKAFFKMFSALLPPHTEDPEVWSLELEYQLLLSTGDKKTGKGGKIVHMPGSSYTSKARTLIFNLKKSNTNLLDRLIKKELTFAELCQLTPEEMQTSDIKQLAKDVHTKAISQTVIENGMNSKPRAKITHKGEEIIDFDSEADEGKTSVNKHQLSKYERGDEETEGGLQFFGDRVNSHFEGDKEHERMNEYREPGSQQFHLYQNEYYSEDEGEIGNNEDHQVNLDDNISAIIGDSLQDEDTKLIGEAPLNTNSSPPLQSTDCPFVWRGELIFSEISNFKACARFVTSTAVKSFETERKQCITIIGQFRQIHEYLQIDGRLNRKTALSYLKNCMKHNKYSLIVEFVPEESGELLIDEEHRNNFIRLFNYFYNRNRFGVIQGKGDSVKDAYLVPYQEGDEPEKVFESFMYPNTIFQLRRSSMRQRLFGVFVTNL